MRGSIRVAKAPGLLAESHRAWGPHPESADEAGASLEWVVKLDSVLGIVNMPKRAAGERMGLVSARGAKLADADMPFNIISMRCILFYHKMRLFCFFSSYRWSKDCNNACKKYSKPLKTKKHDGASVFSSQPSAITWQHAHYIPGSKISAGTWDYLLSSPDTQSLSDEVLKTLKIFYFTKKITWLTWTSVQGFIRQQG